VRQKTWGGELGRILDNKKLLVKTFLIDNLELVSNVYDNPDDVDLYKKLNTKLSRYFIDYFSSVNVRPNTPTHP
jgi:hypothetical protein